MEQPAVCRTNGCTVPVVDDELGLCEAAEGQDKLFWVSLKGYGISRRDRRTCGARVTLRVCGSKRS
jgi:hypothetical protein